jgi:hypothetical protein
MLSQKVSTEIHEETIQVDMENEDNQHDALFDSEMAKFDSETAESESRKSPSMSTIMAFEDIEDTKLAADSEQNDGEGDCTGDIVDPCTMEEDDSSLTDEYIESVKKELKHSSLYNLMMPKVKLISQPEGITPEYAAEVLHLLDKLVTKKFARGYERQGIPAGHSLVSLPNIDTNRKAKRLRMASSPKRRKGNQRRINQSSK